MALILGSESVAASGGSRVPVMQAADVRDRDHPGVARWLDLTRDGCIAVERQVGSGLVVIREVRPQNANSGEPH